MAERKRAKTITLIPEIISFQKLAMPAAMPTTTTMPATAVPAATPAPAKGKTHRRIPAISRVVIRLGIINRFRHSLNITDRWRDRGRRGLFGIGRRSHWLRRGRCGHAHFRLGQHRCEDSVRNALLSQINNLIRVQSVAVPGIFDISDDGVLADFRLRELQNLRHTVSQLRHCRCLHCACCRRILSRRGCHRQSQTRGSHHCHHFLQITCFHKKPLFSSLTQLRASGGTCQPASAGFRGWHRAVIWPAAGAA